MDMFVVGGGRPLAGRCRVSGAKNAALPIMAASLLTPAPLRLRDVPDLVDIKTLGQLLDALGVQVTRSTTDRTLELRSVDTRPCTAEYELVRRMRASICVLGPLLAKRGAAVVSLPGGCNIGNRPVDLHLKGLAALGADIRVERGYIVAEARRLRGARVPLAGPNGSTVTGTCNVMMAATLADGVTTIESAACEPEVVDLGDVLNRMGARITGLGTPTIRIEGVPELSGADHAVIPDRIEAATLLIAAACTRGEVTLDNVRPEHLTAVLDKLREIGVGITQAGDSVLHCSADRPLRPVDCDMQPFPGLPTDTQAQFMALLATVPGQSRITDAVFPDRFMHASELVRLGASIRREGNSAMVTGGRPLGGANVMASDLRASAALVLAGLAARGETVIRRIYHLDRGYERMETKLAALGADIRRRVDQPVPPPPPAITPSTSTAAPLRGPSWLRAVDVQTAADDSVAAP
jgi:UDP-N-acetylglucosamine 1-carboxyvinyltransferase